MHELVLQTPYPLPPQRHSQLLSIFAGVCGMQPVPYLEKHLIFRPNRRPGEEKVELVGGSQAVKTGKKGKKEGEGEVYYLKLVGSRDIPVETGKRDHTQGALVNGAGEENAAAHNAMELEEGSRAPSEEEKESLERSLNWTLQFRDLPEASRKDVTARLMVDTPISRGDVVAFVEGMGYTFITAYYMQGHRFTHQNISIILYRIYIPASTDDDAELVMLPKDGEELGQKLDLSNGYMLQATIRVVDGSKVELMNRGVDELNALKDTLKGVVELEAGERLSMDTRLR